MLHFPDYDRQEILPSKGEAVYYPRFFGEDESHTFYELLKNDIAWKQEPIWMFGKQVMQPRLTALYGNPSISYGYSGIRMEAKGWTDFLIDIKKRAEEVAQTEFTHVLLNYYRDGQDSMGWHRDNEPELGPNPIIASISFGAPREFQFRRYADKNTKRKVVLENGSLLLMGGECQHAWEHQLPKRAGVHGPRINLTFRRIIT